jgi:hypothetical protein
MANFTSFEVYATFLMSDDNPKSRSPKVSSFVQRITGASGKSYIDAADDAARAATTAGVLIDAVVALTKGVLVDFGVRFKSEVNARPSPPAVSVFAFASDKIVTHYKGTVDNSHVSIPAFDGSALTMESNGVDITLADGAAVAAFVNAFEAIALDEDSTIVTVQRMNVSG